MGWSEAVQREAGLKQRSLSTAEGVRIVSVVWYHLDSFAGGSASKCFCFLIFLDLFYLYECFACLCISAPCMSGALRGQKSV